MTCMGYDVSRMKYKKKFRTKTPVPHTSCFVLDTRARGFVLVEAVIAAAVVATVLASVVGALLLTLRSSLADTSKTQSSFLAEEGLEALRIMRDDSWNTNIASHTSGVKFYLTFDGTTWRATNTNIFIDKKFERSVVFSDVYRDSNQDIVSSGGTLDSNTKKVTVSVSWSDINATTTRSLSTYLTNVFNN